MTIAMAEEKSEVFFIPTPLMGHAGSLVQLATTMANRFHNLTINVLVMHLPNDLLLTNYTNSLASSQTNRINFIQFPQLHLNDLPNCPSAGFLADAVIEHHKPLVRDLVAARPRLRALVVDMFCTSMIDVGKEFGIPTYTFFTSNAAFLGIMFHFQTLQDEHGQEISELAKPGPALPVPSYAVPIPPNVLPFVFFDKDSWSKRFLRYARKYREAAGVIVNTFRELEPHALGSLCDGKTPAVYTAGPMLKPETCTPNNEIIQWLDGQPKASVVLLCFGSRGCFNADQVKQIAIGLERSGYGFVWSLREPSPEGRKGFPEEYKDYNKVLPDGFLDRTAGKGKVVGWVPQTAVLGHEAVGGFVSHCGWNSVLESIWYGVPIATWPLYAEQQLDAYQLVKELGLAVEISLDYNQLDKNQRLVLAEEIENGIRRVMDSGSEVRAKVAEMKAKSRMAVEEGGSSFTSLGQLVEDFM